VSKQLTGNPVAGDRLKILAVLEEIMKLSPNSLSCDQRLKDLEQWDSMTELDFVLSIEKTCGVTLDIDAVVNCELVGQLVEVATNAAPIK
jgi:acyl carrier protein